MAQTKTIQLLRSSAAYANIATAKSTLEAMSGRKDGELVLARYWQDNEIKSLLGIYHAAPDLSGTNITENETQGWTFIQDQSTVDAILDNLDFSTGNMSVGGSTATDDSIIVVGVAQNNGQLQAVTAELGSVKVNSVTATSATSKIAADQTLTENLGRLQGQIDDMDLTQVGGTSGDVVTAVSQADGKVSASKSSLTDVVMTGYAADSTKTGAIAATDTLEQAFNKVENAIATNKVTAGDASITMGTANPGGNDTVAVNIKSGEHVLALSSTSGAEGLYTDLDLVKINTNLPTNVKERYQLLATDDTQIGTNIDIYKDSALQSVKLLHADLSDSSNPLKPTYSNGTWTDIASASQTEENLALCYAYLDVNGNTVVEAVPVGNFLRESEFGDGLQVVSGVVSVKVDPLSQSVTVSDGNGGSTTVPVLSVSSNGVKVDNIQEAINYAVANASTTLAVSAQGDNYITAAVDANNNKKINVTADVQDLTATAGTPGVYDSTTGAQTTAPVAGTLSGVADSLSDAADIATKVKTYVDGAIAIEGARSDAKNLADLKTVVEGLDGTATASSATNVDSAPTADFKVLTKVVEVDGKVVETTVTNGSTAVTLKKLAATGAAADVSIADSGNLIIATTVEGALQEIATNVNNNHIVSSDVIVATTDTSNNQTTLSVTTGNGLEKTGTNNDTLAVKQGSGITVDSNGVSVNAGDGLVIDGSGDVDVNVGNGLEISSDAVAIKIDPDSAMADSTHGMLTVSSSGLKLSDTWDCGTF